MGSPELPPRCEGLCPVDPAEFERIPLGRQCSGPTVSAGGETKGTIVISEGRKIEVKPERENTLGQVLCRNAVFNRFLSEQTNQLTS